MLSVQQYFLSALPVPGRLFYEGDRDSLDLAFLTLFLMIFEVFFLILVFLKNISIPQILLVFENQTDPPNKRPPNQPSKPHTWLLNATRKRSEPQ